MVREHVRMVGALLAPLPALAIGVVVMHNGDVPSITWQVNLAAALVGVALAAVTMVRAPWAVPRPSLIVGALAIGLALLGATLLAPGIEGVHRWLPLGPIRIHAAALLLPALLVALEKAPWISSAIIAIAGLSVLLLQPDAAQAVSFGAAWIGIVVIRREKSAGGVILVTLLIAGASLLREDPLDPVPHVEGIIGMAASQGSLLASAGLLSLAVLPLSLAAFLGRPVGVVLGVYMGGTLIAAFLGHHPIPILGYGVSPILGYYGGVATYAQLNRRREGGEREAGRLRSRVSA